MATPADGQNMQAPATATVQASEIFPGPATLPDRITGSVFDYTVQPGDSLASIGARHGVSPALLAGENDLKAGATLTPGQVLRIDHRHIVPVARTYGLDTGRAILINIPQRMLFHYADGRLDAAYPVGLGRPDWRTPAAAFRVVTKETDKTWYVPKSIQAEMAVAGKPVLTKVPPGPENPLGRHWIGLSIPSIGIHGTIAPTSIFQFRSHGCIRLHPDDVADLFSRTELDDPGQIVYAPVLLARLDDGRIFLEAHRDIYRRGAGSLAQVRAEADVHGLTELIDWNKTEEVLRERDGLAREIGRVPDDPARRPAQPIPGPQPDIESAAPATAPPSKEQTPP